jgi:hypothetical protein
MTEQSLFSIKVGDWVIQYATNGTGYDRIHRVTDVTERFIKVRPSRRSAPDARRYTFHRHNGQDDQGRGHRIRRVTAEEQKAWGV